MSRMPNDGKPACRPRISIMKTRGKKENDKLAMVDKGSRDGIQASERLGPDEASSTKPPNEEQLAGSKGPALTLICDAIERPAQ